MSDAEGSDKDEGDMEYTAPISAIPPRIVRQEEGQMEVSSSPAFQCLDELFQQGRMTGTKVAFLKAKYTEVHETLKNSRNNETRLLLQAKNFTSNLDKQKLELEKGDNFPESSNTEVTKMRQKLLKYNNDLSETDGRQYQLEYKIDSLREETDMLQKEVDRLPKLGEIQKRMKELQVVCDEIRKEIGQRQGESKNLHEDLDTALRQLSIEKKSFEELSEQLEKKKSELVDSNNEPAEISKKAERMVRQNKDMKKKLEANNVEFVELNNTCKNLETKRRKLEEEKLDFDSNLDNQKYLLTEKDTELDLVQKDYKESKQREAILLGDRAILDLNLRHIHLERKNLHDIHSRKSREKDRDLRNLKKAELQLRVATETLSHTKSIYDKIKSQVEVLPKDDGTLQKKRTELQREVEMTKRSLAQQNSLTAVEHVKLEASAADEQNLLFEQSDLRIEVVELTRLAAIKADEREQKARDFMRAEMRYHRAVEDLKTKQLSIQDHQKKHQEMQLKLKEFAKLYDIIKNERNKCVNLIQTSTQKSAEMKEKIKILQNEIEILRTAVIQKDRQLQKHRLKQRAAMEMRDSLRKESTKQTHIEEMMREKQEQQKMDISKLNLMINQAEEQMVKLRKRYERAVQHRNDRGVKLIVRNEEVCVFYEKVNIQDQMIRNGEVQLKGREEEIRFIKMQLNEEKRSRNVLRQSEPEKEAFEQELSTLQTQLQQCQDRMLELEKSLENPYDETRVRYLPGKDPTPAETLTKVEELETMLAEKEEQLLEKDLIYDQVNRLADRIRGKAESGKEDTLKLAKKVNDVQSCIKETTRKMMALVAQLSMNQANAMKSQHQLRNMETDLEQCYLHMEKGEPPSDEIDLAWQKTVRDCMRRIQEKDSIRVMEEDEEQYKLAGGLFTTAEPRPNAYIPDDDSDLPIPRPYGSHAPFKPNEPGSSMRHVRKPIPKPIEI